MKNNQTFQLQKALIRYALMVLVATLFINLLSAYIRHVEAGLGCQPWPACYAVIGTQVTTEGSGEIAQKALAPTETAKKMHRAIATLLVIGVLLLIHQSRKPGAMKGVNPALPYLLLAVIVLLSIIGPASYLKTLPVIALINLAGGLALMAVCWWLYLQLKHSLGSINSKAVEAPRWLIHLWLACWLLVVVQILLGSWVSANFAADACNELFSCNTAGDYLNQGNNSFWYFRELALDNNGRVLFDSSAVSIHLAHRLFALLSGAVLLIAALISLKYQKPVATILMALLLAQWLLGAFSILLNLPLILIMAHNLNAALLLMAVMTINFKMMQAK